MYFMSRYRVVKILALGMVFVWAAGCRTEKSSDHPVFHLTKVLK